MCSAASLPTIPRETVTGHVQARHGFAWHIGYDIAFKNATIFVYVAINLIPVDRVTQADLERLKPLLKGGIEQVWSNKFALETRTGERFPILIDVTFKGLRFHHDVTVRRSPGRTDTLHWAIQDRPVLAAHEFGHMIQAFDEYRGGGTNPTDEIIDPTSIMASNPTSGGTYARHYESFRAWFAHKTQLSGISIMPYSPATPVHWDASPLGEAK